MALTIKSIKAAKPKRTPYTIWDTGPQGVPGFGVRVLPSGTKSWVLKYRTTGDKQRWHTFGRVGILPLEDARNEAKALQVAINKGSDPVADEQNKRFKAGITPDVASLVTRYLTHRVEPRTRPRTAAEYRRLLEKHVLPKWSKRHPTDITRADVVTIHEGLEDRPYLANRVLEVIRAMFHYAADAGIIPENSDPCRSVQAYSEKQRQRMLTADELARLGAALDVAKNPGTERKGERVIPEPEAAILAIRLLLFTGCRKTEITTARWEWVDWKRQLLSLPQTKTGSREVPLGPPALGLLEAAFESRTSDWICPGKKIDRPLVGLQKCWERIRAAAGLDDVRIHDLRHTMASVAAHGGQGLPVIAALLGHARTSTTTRYTHTHAHPVHAAAEQVSSQLNSMLKGEKAEIVEIKK